MSANQKIEVKIGQGFLVRIGDGSQVHAVIVEGLDPLGWWGRDILSGERIHVVDSTWAKPVQTVRSDG